MWSAIPRRAGHDGSSPGVQTAILIFAGLPSARNPASPGGNCERRLFLAPDASASYRRRIYSSSPPPAATRAARLHQPCSDRGSKIAAFLATFLWASAVRH